MTQQTINKIDSNQYEQFNDEFKNLISKFFKIHVDNNPAFFAWYAKTRNNIITQVEEYPFIQQFRKDKTNEK